MRSRLPVVVMMLVIASLLVLSSCATSVSVSYMNPSEIDMGRHRTVALTSTVPFEGFHGPGRYVRAVDSMAAAYSRIPSSYDRALADDVAKEATAKLASALASTGFFQIVPPTVSDRLVSRSRAGMQIDDEVQELGIDAFIVPRIVSMDVNEYVSSEREYYYDHSRVDRDGDPLRLVRYRYYLTQTVSIVYSYTVIDASTMTIYATKSFSDKREFVNEVSSRFFSGPRVMRYFDAMLDDRSWRLSVARSRSTSGTTARSSKASRRHTTWSGMERSPPPGTSSGGDGWRMDTCLPDTTMRCCAP